MPGLDKGTLINSIEAAFRSLEPGEDCVRSLSEKLGNAMDAFVKSGIMEGQTTTGGCTASGPHPTIKVIGSTK